MTERINELKAMIETLDAGSPPRKSLEDALNAELKCKAEAEAKAKAEEERKRELNEYYNNLKNRF